MKLAYIERALVGILLVIAGGIVVHAPLTVWLGTLFPSYDLIIKSWKELLMGLALVLLVVVMVKRNETNEFLSDRLVQLCLVYAGLHFVTMALFQNGLQAAGAGLLIDLRFILYFALVYGTLQLYPQYRKLFITVFVGGAVVVLGFAVLQLLVLPKDVLAHIGYSKATIAPYLTVDENPAFIRINSTLRGPNPLGAYAVVLLSALLAVVMMNWGKLKREQWWLVGIGAVAGSMVLYATYSRASIIGLLIAIAAVIGIAVNAKARRLLGVAAIVLAIVAGGLLFAFRDHPVVSNIVLHDSPTTGGTIDSNEGHAESLVDGFGRVVRQPIGGGIGSTGSASLSSSQPLIIENQYMFIAHETGWLGLALFVWLFFAIIRRLWLRRRDALALGILASGLGLSVIGFLHPVWADDTTSIIWWGLAAIAVAAPIPIKKSEKARKRHSA